MHHIWDPLRNLRKRSLHETLRKPFRNAPGSEVLGRSPRHALFGREPGPRQFCSKRCLQRIKTLDRWCVQEPWLRTLLSKLANAWKPSNFQTAQPNTVKPVRTEYGSRRTSDLPVNLVGSVVQIHGQEASFFVVVVFLEPSSDGVGGGFTAVNESQLRRRSYRVMSSETVASGAFAVRRQRRSSTATGRWPPSFFFNAVSEALAMQETTGQGCCLRPWCGSWRGGPTVLLLSPAHRKGRMSLEDRWLFCLPTTTLTTEDMFREAQEVGPDPGVTV